MGQVLIGFLILFTFIYVVDMRSSKEYANPNTTKRYDNTPSSRPQKDIQKELDKIQKDSDKKMCLYHKKKLKCTDEKWKIEKRYGYKPTDKKYYEKHSKLIKVDINHYCFLIAIH